MPAPERLPCTLAILARGAAEGLAETLASAADAMAATVVVDAGAEPAALSAAAERGARVVPHEWREDYSASRNAALEACGRTWALWLEAGETLSPEAIGELRARFAELSPACAYSLIVRTPASAPHLAAEQTTQVRLHPALPQVRFAGRVRETIEPSAAEAGLAIEGLPIVITRGGPWLDSAWQRGRAAEQLRLARLALAQQGPQARLYNGLGEAAAALGDAVAGAGHYREALRLAEAGSPARLEAYYGLLTSLEGAAPGREVQLALCVQALDEFPLDAQLLCAMGGYLQALARADLARRSYELAWRHGEVCPSVWHVPDIGEIAASCLVVCQLLAGEVEAAQGTLSAALADRPESVRLRKQLVELCLSQGRSKEALAEAGRLPANMTGREAYRSAVRGACQAAQRNWPAARAHLAAAFQAGCRDRLCLRGLAATCVALGDREQAALLLPAWRGHDPHDPDLKRLADWLSGEPRIEPADEPRQLRLDAAASSPAPHEATQLAPDAIHAWLPTPTR